MWTFSVKIYVNSFILVNLTQKISLYMDAIYLYSYGVVYSLIKLIQFGFDINVNQLALCVHSVCCVVIYLYVCNVYMCFRIHLFFYFVHITVCVLK